MMPPSWRLALETYADMARTSIVRATAALARARSNRVLLGIFFMMLATSLFPFMGGLAQLLGERYAPDQIVWARVTSHLVFMLILLMPRRGWEIFRTRQLVTQLKRSQLQLLSTSFHFTAIQFMGLAQATAISFTAPFLVTLTAWPILGEPITRHRLVSMVVAFIGVLIIIRPGSGVFQWASVAVLCAAFFYALYQVYTRSVAGHDSPETSVIYSVLIATLVMSIVMLFRWKNPESWLDAAMMFGTGIFGGLGHWCLARAMTYAPANVISPFQYWQLVGAVIVGYFVSGNMPDAYTWVGAAIIIGAGLYLGWRDTRNKTASPR